MARILIRHASGHGFQRCTQAKFRQKLIHVPNFGRELLGPRFLIGVRRKQQWAFLQHRAATGSIVDDRVKVIRVERGEIPLSQVPRHFANTGVRRQRPAARLSSRHHDLAAIGLQYPNRGAVQIAERDLRDAAREESHPRPPQALCRERLAQLAKEKIGVNARQQPFLILQTEQTQNSSCARDARQARTLVELQHAGGQRNPAWVGQKLTIDEIARHARREWPLVFLLDLGPRELQDFSVLHAGRANRLAVAAIQTAIDMGNESLTDFEAPLIDQRHLPDAPARRVRFLTPQTIRWTMVGTQPAMHAARVVRVLRIIDSGKSTQGQLKFALRFLVSLRQIRICRRTRHQLRVLRRSGRG